MLVEINKLAHGIPEEKADSLDDLDRVSGGWEAVGVLPSHVNFENSKG